MLRTQVRFLAAAGAVAAIAGLAAIPLALDAQQPVVRHPVPANKHGGVVVMLCDGKTSVEIKGLKPGQRMSHDRASAVARKLMASWRRDHPGQSWQMAQAQSLAAEATAAQSPPSGSAAPSSPRFSCHKKARDISKSIILSCKSKTRVQFTSNASTSFGSSVCWENAHCEPLAAERRMELALTRSIACTTPSTSP